MESIAVSYIVEVVTGKALEYARQIALGPEEEREVQRCVDESINLTLSALDFDDDMNSHLKTVLSEFVREGGIESFLVIGTAAFPDENALRQLYRDLGGDPDSLPAPFPILVASLASTFTHSLKQSAEQNGSPLFNLIASRQMSATRDQVDTIAENVDSLLDNGDEVRQGLQELLENQRRISSLPSSKALLDGPIRALRLQGDMRRADENADRLESAKQYQDVSRALADAGYHYHAQTVRLRSADAFVEAGQLGEAFDIWIDEGSKDIESGRLWITSEALNGLRQNHASVSSSRQARANAVFALENWFEHPDVSTAKLRESLQILIQNDDGAAVQVATWLGEALATDQSGIGTEFQDWSVSISSLSIPTDNPYSTRLQLLLAEASGDWDSILADVGSGRLSAEDEGLACRRHARWLTLNGKPEEAIQSFRNSVEPFSEAGLLGDAADSMFSIQFVELRYGDLPSDFGSNAALARSIRHETARFRTSFNARSAALESLLAARDGTHGKLPDALRYARRYLWESRISGDISGENDARRILGEIFEDAKMFDSAMENYILSGTLKKAKSIANQYSKFDIAGFLDSKAPWIVGTTLGVLSEVGETIPVTTVETMSPRLVSLTKGVRQGLIGMDVGAEAWNVVASTVLQFPEDTIENILNQIDTLIDREPGTYRRSDDAVSTILIRMYWFRPQFREQASALIIKSLSIPDLAQNLRNLLLHAANENHLLREAVIASGNSGDRTCRQIMVALAIPDPSLVDEANALVDEVLAHEVGVQRTESSISDRFQRAAEFSRLLPLDVQETLARHLLAIANDVLSPEGYRSQALEALSLLANSLSPELQEEAFKSILPLVSAPSSQHPIDRFTSQSTHPLSRFAINMPSEELNRAAYETASSLVCTSEQAQQLLAAGSGNPSKEWFRSTAEVLLTLPPDLRPAIDLLSLAQSQEYLHRLLAVLIWIEGPNQEPVLGVMFAQDPDSRIRERIAKGLPNLGKTQPELASQLQQVLTSDSNSVVRAFAQLFEPNRPQA